MNNTIDISNRFINIEADSLKYPKFKTNKLSYDALMSFSKLLPYVNIANPMRRRLWQIDQELLLL